MIGIKADSDGIYYWTLTSNGTTQWLTDDKGQKLRAGSVMPQLGVDAQGFWTISYDGGKTSTRILDAEGNPVEALNRIFHEVSADGDCLNVTLADGAVISSSMCPSPMRPRWPSSSSARRARSRSRAWAWSVRC